MFKPRTLLAFLIFLVVIFLPVITVIENAIAKFIVFALFIFVETAIATYLIRYHRSKGS